VGGSHLMLKLRSTRRGKKASLRILLAPKFLSVILLVFLGGAILGATVHSLLEEFRFSERPLTLETPRTVSTHVVAVDQRGNGVLGDVSVTVGPGEGNVYLVLGPRWRSTSSTPPRPP